MNKGNSIDPTRKAVMLCLFCVALASSLIGCSGKAKEDETALRQRAEGLGNLLLRIQDMQEAEAKQALEPFIAPSQSRGTRIAQYYRDFSAASKKFRIVSQSITSIRINSDKTTAEVTYKTVAKLPGGNTLPVNQATHWICVDGTWYRTIGDVKMALTR